MRPLLRLLPVVAVRRGRFVEAILWSVVCQAAVLGIAILLARMAGLAAVGSPLSSSAPVIAVLLAVLAAAAAWRESWVSHDLAYRVIGELRSRVFGALRRALPSRSRPRRTGDLATTVVADIETLEWLFAHTIAQALGAVLVLSTAVAVSITVSPQLLLAWTPPLLIGVVVPMATRRRAGQDGAALAADAGALRAELVDTLRGLRELAGAAALERQLDRLAERTLRHTRTQVREASRIGAERAISDLAIAIAVVAAVLVVVADTGIPRADIPLAITLAAAGVAPAAQIADLLRGAGTLTAAAARIDSLLAEPPAVTDELSSTPRLRDARGLCFDGVGFAYRAGAPVLHDLHLHVRPGEIVALTGASGSGKSTAAALASRQWDPDAGAVRIDGVDLRALTDDALRARIAVVPQGSPLLRGTVRSNILLGDPQAPEERITEAARSAGLLDVRSGLPRGLDTDVGEHGAGLSGGQRARVAIARALLRGPRVLVLDEATASLDAEADAAIMELLARQSERAVLLISHRPATIAAAHRVVALSAAARPPLGG
ncbi:MULTISPECIES: ABC transporter ATP-binding protein [unclassified Microbacterium]|uniref:ABC transporter ATP-binding protein n=1 Tax=Microbacterium TaxID=33882 RepID=UPI003BA0EF01